MSDDSSNKKINPLNRIDIGDLVESITSGRLGLVKSVVFADGEPYVYGPYVVVVWTRGYESCWIPHYDFRIVSKISKK